MVLAFSWFVGLLVKHSQFVVYVSIENSDFIIKLQWVIIEIFVVELLTLLGLAKEEQATGSQPRR